jgi:hypothetical protein
MKLINTLTRLLEIPREQTLDEIWMLKQIKRAEESDSIAEFFFSADTDFVLRVAQALPDADALSGEAALLQEQQQTVLAGTEKAMWADFEVRCRLYKNYDRTRCASVLRDGLARLERREQRRITAELKELHWQQRYDAVLKTVTYRIETLLGKKKEAGNEVV